MCEPISISMGIAAATTAIQGGDLGDILTSAAIAGATAYIGVGYMEGGNTVFGQEVTPFMIGSFSSTLGSSIAGFGIEPPSYEGYTPASQAVQQNSQNIETTGSGGRQATASLADAIKRSKKRKLTQEDVGDLSIDTGSFANTGLQLA